MPPLETLPPGDPSGGVFYVRVVCLQRKHLACEYSLTFRFSRGGVVSYSPKPKLEDHPLSAVRDCLFNLFTATFHVGDHSSIRNLRTRHAVVIRTHKHGMYGVYVIKKRD